jgi:hypothetical protein
VIIGHLPAGYLAATAALNRLGLSGPMRRALLLTALVASVAPDLDLVVFYATGGHVHHHAYPTHWPLAWLAGIAIGLAATWHRPALALGVAFAGAAGLLHLALDSIAGAVRWGAPFSDHATTLVDVPARHASWVTSMVLHWTFGAEVVLAVVAGAVWWRSARRPPSRPGSPLSGPAPPQAGA